MSNDIAKAEEQISVVQLIRDGIQSGIPAESMERLMAMRDKELARQAESEFTRAMSEFQSRCPVIEKRKKVERKGGGKLYSYAPLEDIVSQVKEPEHECGFSHSFNTAPSASGGVEVTCIIKHVGGHSERTTVYMPHTEGMNTNAAQDAGISITYGKRLSFVSALGIMTGNEDTDGGGYGEKSADQLYKEFTATMTAVLENYESIMAVKNGMASGELDRAHEAWAELEREVQMALWRAPSKGGPFTTAERAMMKSNEWAAIGRGE